MKLIIDAGVLFTALIGKGVTKEIIFSNLIKLYAPEYLFEEIEKHKPEIKENSGLSSEDFNFLFTKLKSKIKIVARKDFDMFLSKANELILDKDDIEYLALALSKKMPIWSNDKGFKGQLVVKVFTTSELTKYFKSLGYSFSFNEAEYSL